MKKHWKEERVTRWKVPLYPSINNYYWDNTALCKSGNAQQTKLSCAVSCHSELIPFSHDCKVSPLGPTSPRNKKVSGTRGHAIPFVEPSFLFIKSRFVYFSVWAHQRNCHTWSVPGKMKASRSHLCSWNEQGEIKKVKQRAFLPKITQLCEKSSLLNTKASKALTRKERNQRPSKAERDRNLVAFQTNSLVPLNCQLCTSASVYQYTAHAAVSFFLNKR